LDRSGAQRPIGVGPLRRDGKSLRRVFAEAGYCACRHRL